MSDDELIDEERLEYEVARTGLTRQQLLARGVGLAAVGLMGSRAEAALGAIDAKPKRGGKITWALEQDPVQIAPFGQTLTAGHWGKEFIYDSLLEWDRNLNQRPALAESWKVVNPTTVDFTLKKGIKFHNGKELTAADAKYSFDLQANPPPPGTVATLSQFPAIATTEVLSKYKLRISLKKPDASLFGYLAWSRYSPIVPQGMYDQLNPAREGIGTGPMKLVRYTPNDAVELVRNPNFWRKGQPYLDALTLKVLTDEQARIAALRAGAIDGATLSPDAARQFNGQRGFKVLKNYTAAFRELQLTLKDPSKAWIDGRVRRAVNHAINRQEMIDKVYGGNGAYSGHVPPGYGPCALASVLKEQLKRINIDVSIEAQEPGTFGARNSAGSFEWDLTARGMRGDVIGYTNEFNPSNAIYGRWFGDYKNTLMWKRVGQLQITLDHKKRMPIAKALEKQLLESVLIEIPLIAVQKFQVVRTRVKNMYVAFSDFNTGLRYAWVE